MQVRFREKARVVQRLENLCRQLALSVNLLKGRVTPEEASFEFQVAGAASNIRRFVRKTQTCGPVGFRVP
jgi:hypothetical protein